MRFVAFFCICWMAVPAFCQDNQQGDQVTYTLKLDDELIDLLKRGEPLESAIPEHIRGYVTTVRLVYAPPDPTNPGSALPNNTSGISTNNSFNNGGGFAANNNAMNNSALLGNQANHAGADPTAFNNGNNSNLSSGLNNSGISNSGISNSGLSNTTPFGPTLPPQQNWNNNTGGQAIGNSNNRIPVAPNTNTNPTFDRGFDSNSGGQFQPNTGQPPNNYSRPSTNSSSDVDTVSYPPMDQFRMQNQQMMNPRDNVNPNANFANTGGYPNNVQNPNVYGTQPTYPYNDPRLQPYPNVNQGYGFQNAPPQRLADASMQAQYNQMAMNDQRRSEPMAGHSTPLIPDQPLQGTAAQNQMAANASPSTLPPASINGQLPNAEEPKRLTSTQSAILWFMLLCSIGLNVYLGWIARGFYVRYQELADDLRETFATAS